MGNWENSRVEKVIGITILINIEVSIFLSSARTAKDEWPCAERKV